MTDIQGPGDHAMIEKYGMKLNDTVLAEPHQLGLYDDLINNRQAKLIPGGGAQNTARGAQYMLPKDSVWYVGCVGDDEYAEILRKSCAEQGEFTHRPTEKKTSEVLQSEDGEEQGERMTIVEILANFCLHRPSRRIQSRQRTQDRTMWCDHH